MKVLYVNSLFPTQADQRSYGGAETFSLRLVKGLLEVGHDVRIVRSATSLAGGVEHLTNGVDVHSMPLRNVYSFWDGRSHAVSTRAAWHIIEDRGRIPAAFQQMLTQFKPDIVHTNTVAGLTTDLWRVAHEGGYPILHTLHDYYLTCPTVMRFSRGERCLETCRSCSIFSQRRRKATRYIDKVIGVSQRMLDIHVADGLFPDTPSNVILNCPPPQSGIPVRPPGLIGPRPVFGFIGRQALEKGTFELFEAFAKLKPGSASLIVAGKIEPAAVDWVAQNVPRPEDVVFTGFTTHDKFYPMIDVAVIPSIWEEPCSMCAGEAFSYGIPSLGSTRGGIPEMLEGGQLGWLFEPGTDQLAASLARLVADPAEISRKAEIIRSRRVDDPTDRLVEAYDGEYHSLLAQPAKLEVAG